MPMYFVIRYSAQFFLQKKSSVYDVVFNNSIVYYVYYKNNKSF